MQSGRIDNGGISSDPLAGSLLRMFCRVTRRPSGPRKPAFAHCEGRRIETKLRATKIALLPLGNRVRGGSTAVAQEDEKADEAEAAAQQNQ